MVNWEVTCGNDKIHYRKNYNSSADESTLDMYIWCSEAGVTGTFTVKAWYEGYEGYAAIKTFNVHTEGDMVELTPEQRAFFIRWAALSSDQKEMLMNLVNSMK